jgi:hypothetical protein
MLFRQIRLLLYFFISVEGIDFRGGLIRLLSRVVSVRDGKATLSLYSGGVLRTRRKDLVIARGLKQSKRRKRLQERLMN